MTTTDRRDATDAQFADELARLERLDVADESAVERVIDAMVGAVGQYATFDDLARAAIHALKPAPGTDTSGQVVHRVLDLRERVHGLVVAHDIASDANGELFADRLDDLLHAAVAGPQRDHDEEGEQ